MQSQAMPLRKDTLLDGLHASTGEGTSSKP